MIKSLISIHTFLYQAIISSLRIAFRSAGTLKLGDAKQRAAATIDAVIGPLTPMDVMNSDMLGVKRNGTGRLASNSPLRIGKKKDLAKIYFSHIFNKKQNIVNN